MRFNNCGKSQKFNKIFLLMLAVLMICSLFLTSACNKEDGSGATPSTSPSVSASPTPTPALIKNGNFEDTYDTTSYPKVPRYWTSAGDSFDGVSASKSNSKTGVINVGDDEFTSFIDTFGDDPELENPKTPAGIEDKNIIMIYNKDATAVKYKSQSITVPANSYAVLTVYVKTVDIMPIAESGSYEYYGASIALTSGSETMINVSGIDTEQSDKKDDNGWVKYQFYVESSLTSSKTVYIDVGLGTGSPSKSIGYTSGFAFFDDVAMEYVSKAAYLTAIDDNGLLAETGGSPDYLSGSDNYFTAIENKTGLNLYYLNRIDAKTNEATAFAYAFNDRSNIETVAFEDMTDITEIDPQGHTSSYYQDLVAQNPFDTESGLISTDNEDYSDDFKNYPFSSDKAYVLNNKTLATQGYSLFQRTIPAFSVKDPSDVTSKVFSHYRIGLYVKTSDFFANGLNIFLVHKSPNGEIYNKYHSFTAINTTTSNIEEDDLETEENKHNKWSNWVEYVFYVEASPYEDIDIELQLWLGPQDVTKTTLNQYTQGHAMFSEASIQKLTKSEYSSASAGDTAKTGIQLYDTKSPQIANSGFNTSADFISIVNNPVIPANWYGYFGGSKQLIKDSADFVDSYDVISGIIHEDYVAAYSKLAGLSLGNINPDGDTGKPNYLLIYNKKATAYGYTTPSKTFSVESYYKISVMVKTGGGAKANIYLTDENGKVMQNQPLSKAVSFAGIQDTDWTEYVFYVQTGELSKSYKLELWNGDRSGAGTMSQGYVLYDDAVLTTITKDIYDEIDAEGKTNIHKVSYDGVDIAPSPSPEVSPSPVPSETVKPDDGPYVFPWGLLTTSLTALALIFVLIVIFIRKIKKSRINARQRVIKVEKPSYSRDNLRKTLNKKSKAHTVKDKADADDDETETYEEYESEISEETDDAETDVNDDSADTDDAADEPQDSDSADGSDKE